MIKNLVVMSNPDFVKLTREERDKLDAALKSNDFVSFDELNNTLNIGDLS